MFDRLKPIAATALLIGASLAAPVMADDSDVTADTVVATVGDTDITLGHMLTLREGLPEQFGQVPADVMYKGILDQLVQQTLLVNAHEGDLPKRAELALENERRALIATEEMAAIIKSTVTDEAVQAYFDENYANAEPVTEYKAAHILVKTEEEAQKIADEARSGTDFDELAKANSTDASAQGGGDLGWFSDGMMVEPFQEAVAKMEPGDISDPVQTDFGWHVIKLEETRMKEAPTLDDVRDEIEETLRQQAIAARITKLEETGSVDRTKGDEMDPSVLSRFELLEE